MAFTDLQRVDFAKNASFKSYGVICLSSLPPTLPEELLMDRRNSSEFFLRRRVCILSDSFCRTTDSSLFIVNELLSFLAWPVHIGPIAHMPVWSPHQKKDIILQ